MNYKRTVLHGTPEFEIVSCEWNSESVSYLHGHGDSQCSVLIQEGTFENRSEFGLKTELSVLEPGQVISTPLGVAHEIRCLSEFGKILHVYTPRIRPATQERLLFGNSGLLKLRETLDLKLGESPAKWDYLERLLREIEAHSVTTSSPYFMNQLFSGVLPETLAAQRVISYARTTMATFEASPTFTAVELEVVNELGAQIGWPKESRDGIGVAGGSAANFMAVHCARQKRFPEARKSGHPGVAVRIFCSSEAHYSMKKACLATGLGTDALVEVAVDARGRMKPESFKRAVDESLKAGAVPLLVCATAGTTVLGAFDPLPELADLCAQHGIWLHVDGAWGGPALFSKRARPLLQGVERADSMTFDAHKLYGANLTSSFFLNRHPGLLLEANDVAGGDYIFHADETVLDRGRLSWQCGRGADALMFWTLWKSQGSDGLGGFVDRLFELRDQCVAWIQTQPRLQLIAQPEFLNICVRVLPEMGQDANWSKHVRDQLKKQNIAFVNFAKNEDGSFLRLILANPRLEFSHLKTILQAALDLGE